MAYAATSDYIEYAHIKTQDSDVDEVRWTNHITRAQAMIDSYCNRTFEAATAVGTSDAPVTRYYDYIEGVQGDILYLDRDLCEIGSVTYGDSDGTTIDSDQYVTYPRNDAPYDSIKILDSANVNWTYDSDTQSGITVSGIWAYSKTPPADVVWATIRTVDWMEKLRTSNVDLDRPALAGEGTIILPTRLPADVRMVLDKYRRMRVA